jgi:hypothetical protein
VVIYDLFVGDVLHARLKLSEEVAGPIEETGASGDVPVDRRSAPDA